MCGIAGLFDTRGKQRFATELITRINNIQAHRGPDELGLHQEPGLAFGHRRLSVIDVSTGQQPLFNEDQSVVIVFNGEIYNYQELVPELKALGHVFHTRSDTEVIIHAWEAWGEACVLRLRGMFAFAIWDRNQQTLFLARDRLGVKPMHYALLADGSFVFGSELKVITAHPGFDRAVDPLAVEEYFALGYVADPRCIYRGAHKLTPGHTLTLRHGQPMPPSKPYWDVHFSLNNPISSQDAQAELLARLQESVRLRMIAEVPLGACLSGGVDRSAVVATFLGGANLLPDRSGAGLRLLRPERLRLRATPPQAGELGLRARVRELAFQGATVEVRLCGAADLPLIAIDTSADLPDNLRIGAEIWCCWNPADSHLLEASLS